MTPLQFNLLAERHKQDLLQQEHLNGILCSLIVNHSMRAPEHAMKPADFMPQLRDKQKRASKPRIDRKAVASKLTAMFQAYMKRHEEQAK